MLGRGLPSERPTPPQPSPSLREREGATAVVPSHARQGPSQRKANPSPTLPFAARKGGSSAVVPSHARQGPSQRMAKPSPTLPFAARKGGSRAVVPSHARLGPSQRKATPSPALPFAARKGGCRAATPSHLRQLADRVFVCWLTATPSAAPRDRPRCDWPRPACQCTLKDSCARCRATNPAARRSRWPTDPRQQAAAPAARGH